MRLSKLKHFKHHLLVLSTLMFNTFILLFVLSFSLTALADNNELLNDDWASAELVLNEESNEQAVSFNDASWSDYTIFKLKSDIAYANEITLARTSARVLAEGAPSIQSYVKADIQFNYLNYRDDLIENNSFTQSNASSETNIKINDLWAQLTAGQCNAKLGRYALLWGNVEGTGAVDVVAPFDATEPLLTDYSLIRRSQDILQTQCFFHGMNLQLFVIPQPFLDQYTLRQMDSFDRLEKELSSEWGGKFSKSYEGLDVSFYYGHFMANTPRPVIDLTSFTPVGVYVDAYELLGSGFVWAKDRLLLEMEFAYKRELEKITNTPLSPSMSIAGVAKQERFEVAFGAEYITPSEHQFAAGVWFYEYEENPILLQFKDTFLLTTSWSKQFLNDALTLSSLAFWQKEPEQFQLTLMADYLLNDDWSISSALSYRDLKLNDQTLVMNSSSRWVSQVSVLLSF